MDEVFQHGLRISIDGKVRNVTISIWEKWWEGLFSGVNVGYTPDTK